MVCRETVYTYGLAMRSIVDVYATRGTVSDQKRVEMHGQWNAAAAWRIFMRYNCPTALYTCFQPAYIERTVKSSKQDEPPASKRHCSSSISSPTSIDATLTTERSMALMRDCHLAWDQLRKLRRCLQDHKIKSLLMYMYYLFVGIPTAKLQELRYCAF